MAGIEREDPILFSLGATIVLKSVDAFKLRQQKADFEGFLQSQDIPYRITAGQSDRLKYELTLEDSRTAFYWIRDREGWEAVDHFNI